MKALSDRYSWVRLGIFLGGVAFSIAAYGLGGWWVCLAAIVVSLVVFGVVAFYHGRLSGSIERHRAWLKFKRSQVARLTLHWPGIVYKAGSHFSGQTEHPFETDLDLTGERSIHHLLDIASTQEGSLRLREWLLTTTPDLPTIRRRQALVGELAGLPLFRDKLNLKAALTTQEFGDQWEGRRLLAWLDRNRDTPSLLRPLLLMAGLCAATLGLFVLGRFDLVPSWLWLATFVIYAIIYNVNSEKTKTLLDDAYIITDGLARLKSVLIYLETYRTGRHVALADLLARLTDQPSRPSRQLRQSNWVLVGAGIQRNFVFWLVLNILVPWKFYFAHQLNRTKAELSRTLPGWLEVWFELEALNSLANFSYLNPGYTFPQVGEGVGYDRPVFEGRDLGHPLIAEDKKVCNDFSLPGLGEVIIVTGSNMAGKSSFLRTLGVNLVLAYAGGPVNARALHTASFRVFTCIKVSDSVTDGFSYFYAEVRRLKALLTALDQPGQPPLFFLIDEIFRGTNNRERLIGSRSYVRALVGRDGVGAISTHDLELVKLSDGNPQITNYHFREEVVDGLMTFDYRLRSGPSPTTNALKIMRLEGLPVELTDEVLSGKE